MHIVIAGPPEDCGEKVYNLRRAVEALPEQFEVIVFTDSDVRLSRGLAHEIDCAAARRPHRSHDHLSMDSFPAAALDGGFASAMASAWNASVATMLGRPRENFCWGGGTAIRRKTFDDVNVLEAWKGAVSDDFAMTTALEQAGKAIVFCPECLAVTLHPWTTSDLLEFTNRQMLITRVYSPRRWWLGAAAHLGYSLTLIFAVVVIVITMAGGDPWGQLLLMTLVIPLLAVMKGAIRTIAVNELLPEWKGKLQEWSWVWAALAPVVPFLYSWNFIASLLSRQLRWRGIRYELVSPSITRILKR